MQLTVQFDKTVGAVKPMHATNNGPVFQLRNYEAGTTNVTNCNKELFEKAGIPYGRTHDSSFCAVYGLDHTVDVHLIFPNFDADENDPASYDFACTDHYMKCFQMVGTKVFYRLGSRIEHEVKKYGTLPPKDFHKWARICEHIIRHYNEGWADGFHMNIEYWEIWNEPELEPDDSTNKRCWGGTKKEFFEFYHVAATHLKTCFPHLKIGGPAIAGDMDWAEEFLAQLKAPLDFFSWHRYAHLIERITTRTQEIRAMLDRHGFKDTESILNEWNYVLDWHGEKMLYSRRMQKGIKGAAFTLSAMLALQKQPLDMLMYYDASPALTWNGMFDPIAVGIPLKGYFPFPMFNEMYRLGQAVECADGENVYVGAAKNGNEAAVVFSHFNDCDDAEPQSVTLNLKGFGFAEGTEVEVYLLDETHDLELVQKFIYYSDRYSQELLLPNFTSYLFKLKQKA